MIKSLIWLAFVGLLSLCEEFADLGQGFWPRHSRSAHGLWGDYPYIVVPLYFAKQGFETVFRIIKR